MKKISFSPKTKKAALIGGAIGAAGLVGRQLGKTEDNLRVKHMAWRIGFTDGLAEAKGEKSSPGAAGLAFREMRYGPAYVAGRQHALARHSRAGGNASEGTGSRFVRELATVAESL
jgi:hypothetical protein